MENAISVGLINRYIKQLLESDYRFKHILVTGEISNLKKHFTGHWYFTLKDEESRINAVMFASNASKVKEDIKDGSKVIVTASIGVYEKAGTYQLYVSKIELVGSGSLYQEYEKLKKKLYEEGLFDESHKIAIPKYPINIGVITAPKGAAIRDIITTTTRRWPIANLVLIPALVQGEDAKESLVKALKKADEMNFDVIIFGRGGGSIEDLWPFNEEIVARQIYATKTPIISAVGHEIDFTISDFVADIRAATPTAGAELATPNILELQDLVLQNKNRLFNALRKEIEQSRMVLNHYKEARVLTSSESLYATKVLQLDALRNALLKSKEEMFKELTLALSSKKEAIKNEFKLIKQKKVNEYKLLLTKLNSMNPLNVLNRGYGIVLKDNVAIESINKVNLKDEIKIRLSDGSLLASVTSKEGK